MVPFESWVKALINACAKLRESNIFTNVNTFQKSPIVQGTIDTSQSPQNGNNGIVSAVTFADNNNATVGSVCATYSNTEAKGMYLKVSQGKLGIEKTDEGKYVTYAPAPDEDGGNNQIVTLGYVNEALTDLTQDNGDIKARLTQAEARITALETQLAGLDLSTDNTVTFNGTKPVKGSGIYTFVTGQIDEITRNLNETIKESLENNIITSINFGTPKEKSVSGDTYTFTPEEPGIMLIKFYRKGSKHCRWYKNDNLIAEAGAGDGTVIQTYPLRSGVKYKWECDGGVHQAVWIPLYFQVGE